MMAGGRKMVLVFTIVWMSLFVDVSRCLQCLSHDGTPVDWFVIYKLPEIRHAPTPIVHEGQGFYYMDEKTPTLKLSPKGMNDTGHAVYNTLQQIYKNQSMLAYIMYNDQPPDHNPSLNHGHTKGTVAFDKKGGFWLIHSTPEFPPLKDTGYYWRKSACTFGQTFLCISMNYNTMDQIGEVFNYTYPKIYDKSLPSEYVKDLPFLAELVLNSKQIHVTRPPWSKATQIVTKGGKKFFSFEKFTDFHADLYDQYISGLLKEDLLVETWRVHGEGDLPSNCSIPYKVYNIEEMKFPDDNIHFNTSKDHSKWAISKDTGDWLCIGDINRQVSQFKRGGGQVCFQNHGAWTSFKDLVALIEPCKSYK